LGRAVALSVIVFFLLGIGWPFLVQFRFSSVFITPPTNWYDDNHVLQDCLLAFSPFLGPITVIKRLEEFEIHGRGPIWLGLGIVILIKSALAGLLFWLTLRTFDRCLGRTAESALRACPPNSASRNVTDRATVTC
jgi:hypothetical protein